MEYGLDYAMHRHDIERLEEVGFWECDKEGDKKYKNMVNVRMAQGWKVLFLFTDLDTAPQAVMGIPRPKICDSNFDGSHEETVKVFDLRDNEWCCPKCVELENNKNPLSSLGSPQC